jgi:hypothetical protein
MTRAQQLATEIVGYLARADRLASDIGLLRMQVCPPCSTSEGLHVVARDRAPVRARVVATVLGDGSTFDVEIRVTEAKR